MKNIKDIILSIFAIIGLVALLTGASIQERQIGKYQIDCEFRTSDTSRPHCVTLDTETGEIFQTQIIRLNDFKVRRQ
tara:strand:+ start:267 stop:497 length:231 start_codon:yes stop_codon:yes gene_type:complete